MSQKSSAASQGGDPWFEIVNCDECGHVYGVFAKIVHTWKKTPNISMPKPF